MAQSGHSSATQRSADEVSRQLVEERLGFLQVQRIEAFSEPAVNRRQQFARLQHLVVACDLITVSEAPTRTFVTALRTNFGALTAIIRQSP
jgi:hypothetical protein